MWGGYKLTLIDTLIGLIGHFTTNWRLKKISTSGKFEPFDIDKVKNSNARR